MDIGYIYGFNSNLLNNGGAIHAYNLTRCLTQLGHRVHTFEPETAPHCITYAADEKGISSFVDNVDVMYYRIDGYYLSATPLKRKLLDMNDPTPMVWEINSSAQEMLKLHSIQMDNKLTGRDFRTRLRRWSWRRDIKAQVREDESYRKRVARRVFAATCVSSALGKYAKEALAIEKCYVIPNGSDPELFTPDKATLELVHNGENKFTVLYAGDSRWPWQGYDLIEKLTDYALTLDEDIRFVIFDNNPGVIPAKGANSEIFPSVAYGKVPEYMASVDACLCLYHNFAWSDYGFHLSPLKLFDYMASGKPVVGTNMGQIAEVITDGKDGLLSENRTETLFEKIKYLKDNKSVAESIGRSAREKIISRYNWQSVARQTADILKSAVVQDGE